MLSLTFSIGRSSESQAGPVEAFTGDDVILPCYLKPISDNIIVEWTRSDQTTGKVHLYKDDQDSDGDQLPEYKGRTSLFNDQLINGNVSLKLSKVTLKDTADYKCSIPNEEGQESNIKLQVARAKDELKRINALLAGIKTPVTKEDKEWAVASLSQLGRFTGMWWMLSQELPQTRPIKTFDGLVTSPGYAQAEDKALFVLSSLAVNSRGQQQIERDTVGQAKNALWSAYRKKRITASNFGLVLAAVKRNSYPPSLFKTLLGQYNLKEGSKACDWGILHEPRAKQLYTEHTGDVIQERGLFLSDSGLLGGSPDGTVSCDCMIEVKCPWSARTKTILQAAESRDFFLEVDEVTGSLTLKNIITTGTKSRATYT
ncbi:hypothetical protein UPYG_G00243550 [Umbra pygmaea]|uniref:Ig-like domain-containing protein n=1 Tax=Umbra pygmaea TaxID=75934 RepID=A0ABD0X6B7_UMBPY